MNLDNTVIKLLGIEVKSLNKEKVQLIMPVDKRTHQPAGFLHGGASVLLAETAASVGAYLNIDPDKQHVFGLEINANHIKSKRTGWPCFFYSHTFASWTFNNGLGYKDYR